ncbi:hypothetical protein [Actinophytocola sp.]|uniref:hypothetical protein n=1 Tax=Actinophytocola sp. TaxID=1872138 RepID=UPI00389AA305
MPAYPAVLREVARVLRSGGVFVHVGVHPCFRGGFADHSDPDAVVTLEDGTEGGTPVPIVPAVRTRGHGEGGAGTT